MGPRLSQFKSYLKILDIPYFTKDSFTFIIANIVKKIIQSMHIFNNVVLISRPQVIKAFPKSNIAVIYIDIWNAQSGFML